MAGGGLRVGGALRTGETTKGAWYSKLSDGTGGERGGARRRGKLAMSGSGRYEEAELLALALLQKKSRRSTLRPTRARRPSSCGAVPVPLPIHLAPGTLLPSNNSRPLQSRTSGSFPMTAPRPLSASDVSRYPPWPFLQNLASSSDRNRVVSTRKSPPCVSSLIPSRAGV